MAKNYTRKDIEYALKDMQGFVDVTTQDVQELLSILSKNKAQQKRKKQKQIRSLKFVWLKMVRSLKTRPSHIKRVKWREIVYSWAFSFAGIGVLGLLNVVDPIHIFTIGSFGASAVLIYGAPRSPLAQPRNLIGGHVLSALVGVAIYYILPNPIWLSAALSVSLAIAVMHITKTLHPPGGATALIAIIGGDRIHALGFGYAIMPVFIGACLMLIVAWIANNSVRGRRYPLYWF